MQNAAAVRNDLLMRPRTTIKLAGRRRVFLPSVGQEELSHAYHECRGNVTATAQWLGVHRSTVYRLLERYGIVGYINLVGDNGIDPEEDDDE